MHKSGFVALAMLILLIAVVILVLTSSGARRDIAHGSPPTFTLGR
jgi:hypothetical protein